MYTPRTTAMRRGGALYLADAATNDVTSNEIAGMAHQGRIMNLEIYCKCYWWNTIMVLSCLDGFVSLPLSEITWNSNLSTESRIHYVASEIRDGI